MADPSPQRPAADAPPFSAQPVPAVPNPEAQRTVELKDIHLPDGVSPWPPGPGIWLVVVGALVAALTAWLIRRRLRGPNLAASARAELEATLALSGELERAEALSVLLRRLVKSHPAGGPHRADVKGDWLGWLATELKLAPPGDDVRRAVTDALYRRNAGEFEDIAALTAFATTVVDALPRTWPSPRTPRGRTAGTEPARTEPGHA